MPAATDEKKFRLVETLLHASGQEEVKRVIDAAVEGLGNLEFNDQFLVRIVEKTISELEQFSPMNKDFQQWSNIKMARIYLNRIKRRASEKLI